VHPLAAAAIAEPRTGRVPPLGGAFNDLVGFSEIHTPAAAHLPYRNEISRRCEGDKHRTVRNVTETGAPRNKLFDPDEGRWGSFTELGRFYGNDLLPEMFPIFYSGSRM
jgi:hypothetical protein